MDAEFDAVTAVPGALPRRPLGSGDEWVVLPDGRRFWGRFGAAGLLVSSPEGVLLQQRAGYSHFGGTWGLPGGARHEGESAIDAAVREAGEEAGVPADGLRLHFAHVLDLGAWSYTTVSVSVPEAFDPVIGDAESEALAWVPVEAVARLPLHPSFGEAWPDLRAALEHRPVLVVDGANVVGTRPNGWWRDRSGAATGLAQSLQALTAVGMPSGALGLPLTRWWPQIRLVLEGRAKDADTDAAPDVVVDRAGTDGDTAVLEYLAIAPRPHTVVVTADRTLAARAEELGARILSPAALLDHLETPSP